MSTVNPIQILKDEFAQMPLSDAQALVVFIPLASRLAAVGEAEFLGRWREAATKLKIDVGALLCRRSMEGIWDVNHLHGKELGVAVIDAQDYAIFAHGRDGRLLVDSLPTLGRHFEQWFENANDVYLDSTAIDIIERYKRAFPIPPELMLANVAEPMPLLAANLPTAMSRRQVVEAEWPQVDVATPATFRLDDLFPTEYHRKCFRQNERPFRLPDGTTVLVTQELLTRQWTLRLTVERPDGSAVVVESMRLGPYLGYRAELDSDSVWQIDLQAGTGSPEDYAAFDLPLIINLSSAVTLKIRRHQPS